jgi:amino acid adenylation domain-containing protein
MNFADAAGPDWISVAAAILGLDAAVVTARAATASFIELGGTSLRAAEYIGRLAQDCDRVADIGPLLGPAPLAQTGPGRPGAACPSGSTQAVPPSRRAISRTQEGMLFAEQLWGQGRSPFHLLFSADICGGLDSSRLKDVLAQITSRHESLRTVFTRDPETGTLGRRVIPAWSPVIIEHDLPALPPGANPVDLTHALLAPAAPQLLRPYHQPPVVFALSHVASQRAVLSVLAHHAVADGFSIGLLWQEIATRYGARSNGRATGEGPAPGMDHILGFSRAATARQAASRRAAALTGWPKVTVIPSDLDRPRTRTLDGTRLTFGLTDAARASCEILARALGVTRNTVLLAAWALVIARRAGLTRLIVGMAVAGRPTALSGQVVGGCAKVLPVACEIPADDSVAGYLHKTAQAMRDVLESSAVPFEDIVAALGASGDLSRNPLVQVAFGAHDELVPGTLTAGDVTFEIREGHCGGAAYDASLYVQKWNPRPVLAIEYAVSVLTAGEAADLASSLDCTLTEMAAAPHGPLAGISSFTARQRRKLISAGSGPAADTSAGLWQLIEDVASRHPDAIAVRDTDPARTVSYRQLVNAAVAQSAELAAAGVKEGDCVAIAVRRSVSEIVAILAILRLGAAYTGLETVIPPAAVATMLDLAGVRVILGDPGRLASLGAATDGRETLPVVNPWGTGTAGQAPPAAAPDAERTAYVAFTSGSTGPSKGTMVACRGVVRLARNPAYLRPGACARFMRLAPLAFDASTLEIFAPLLAAGTIEVFPGAHVTPDALATFLHDRAITGLWLTAGLFRLAADYRPDGFRNVVQLLTGGDVVPPPQVTRVLRTCPGLRISNGYGPTENTTFTTVCHIDDGAAAATATLPIGRPIQGTGVLVLDPAGRLVPPGGIGELFTYGDGVAKGYAGLPAQTAEAFGKFSADSERMLYRTGDLVRWDAGGNLRFLGRRDRQVKIRGFRVELDHVASVLREHPDVRDVAVVAATVGDGDRQMLAAVIGPADPALPSVLRSFAAERIPGYAVPSLWAVVEEFPITLNGKLDVTLLTQIATERHPSPAPAASPAPPLQDTNRQAHDAAVWTTGNDVEEAIAEAWQEVLGHRNFRCGDPFFEVGGDSLQLLHVHAILSRTLAGWPVTMADLYACPTIGGLAIRMRAGASARCRTGREHEPQEAHA